ncbi:Microsomal glutathione S-transferase 1 [Merluccius polli]|uniref:Microsomal glutathione S-transferase 1 n=1 Tax=Merluccius polli TaxID=89951 RepID=A0AA47N273_MERPO|nr:Microsomal glutathione S-transferase 1 [Merluccius polli]
MADLFELDVFQAYATYATVVVLKMMLMGPLTAYFRMTRGVGGCDGDGSSNGHTTCRTQTAHDAFSNEEDVRGKSEEQKKKLLRSHPDVERVRRCHQNDLENIIPFVVVGLLYSLTAPDVSTALILFRVFAASRFCHTLAYVLPLPQPSRALAWMTGMVVTFCMAYRRDFREVHAMDEFSQTTMEGKVMNAFATYAVLVVVKMMLMAPLTSYFRMTKKVFANKEDTKLVYPVENLQFVRVDPDVERVRRCHQNDLENIIPFVIIGLLYSLTAPDISTALIYFRVFAASRICHTLAYILPLPQPSRALAWMTGMVVTFCMAFRVLTVALHLLFDLSINAQRSTQAPPRLTGG